MNILMAGDNQSTSETMQMFFLNEGWEATFEYDGKERLDAFLEDPQYWSMITLDLNLPTPDGMLVGKEIRKVSSTIPIIMLTVRDSESDQVIGLEMGADDYVAKPFSPLTLITRMKALHHRSELAEAGGEVVVSDDHFDIETNHFKVSIRTRETYLSNWPIEGLTPKGFDLLFTLAKKPRQVFSREQLLKLVWDYQYFGDERTVGAHIKKLRREVEKVGPQVIQTVRGVGYKFDGSGVA